MSISIQQTLVDQAETLAQQFGISQSQLFELAIENFIKNYQDQPEPNRQSNSSSEDEKSARQVDEKRLVINRGDIYWVQLASPSGSEPGILHPHVVIQDNVLNHSRIKTVIACALTSNMKRANIPGNVLLEVGEVSLPKQSVVETSKVSTVDKTQLGEYIGSLSEQRINQILDGMRFLQLSFFDQ